MGRTKGTFYEFFSGGGMVRAGLGNGWQCLFANDFDQKKANTYRKNWGDEELFCGDVKDIKSNELPGLANLVWASFPCQDLSLAGGGAGLKGERSGTFWPFWSLMNGLVDKNKAPEIIVLENVCGALTSHGGKDFVAICRVLKKSDYQFGAVVVDAALFVPQSRPRLFVIAVRGDIEIPDHIQSDSATSTAFHTRALQNAHLKLPKNSKENWVWWKLPAPPKRKTNLSCIIENEPDSVVWHTPAETRKLISMMSTVNLEKVRDAKRDGRRMVGTVYKRTRRDEHGCKVQRAEVRFDDIAGCLRTPAGGSSRQLVIVVEGKMVRSRLISSRETARLMGLSEKYILPKNYNESYHLTGDGVVVPVVSFLAKHVFEPVMARVPKEKAAAA